MAQYILSIDQGTTSSRAIIFDLQGNIIANAQQEFEQIFVADGWVEHDPETIWQSVFSTCQQAIKDASVTVGLTTSDIMVAGITNQRETTIVWDKNTGKCLYNAIVWQDRRTAKFCQNLANNEENIELIASKTGLLLDPYFSASKIAWILDNVTGAREQADQEQLCFGTVDSYLLWRLTAGKEHATDATNASRTSLFNIHTNEWDEELLSLFNVPKSMLPIVKDCADDFGVIDPSLFGAEIAIGGVAGDQQAALIGQACFTPGMIKSTYGTGCFMVMNTGDKALRSNNNLLTTIGYRLNGKTTYALEGSIFMAGATIQWLRDGLKLINNAQESEDLARETIPNNSEVENHVYMVPAFTGLGAPYWHADARGAIVGLTRDSGIKEIVTAALQAVCYQSKDLLEAMKKDGAKLSQLRVDGGMVNNNWLMQFLSDVVNVDIERPVISETTALGVAYLAGLQAGAFTSLEQVSAQWQRQAVFTANMSEDTRQSLYSGWLKAVESVMVKSI